MRPRYETRWDQEREEAVALRIARAWNSVCYRQPPLSAFDYRLERDGEMKGWLEVKVRTCRKADYPTYLLSQRKWEAMKAAPERAYLAVQWRDCLGWCEAKGHPAVQDGGRKDRNDSQDIEPCVLIPMAWFHLVRDTSEQVTGDGDGSRLRGDPFRAAYSLHYVLGLRD